MRILALGIGLLCICCLIHPPLYGQDDELGLPPDGALQPAVQAPAAQATDGFTALRIRQIVVILAGLGLCSAWFTAVAQVHKLRDTGDSRPARVSNTVNFLTFGILAVPTLVQLRRSGTVGARIRPAAAAKGKPKKKRGKGDEAEVVFLSSDGLPRDPGSGEAAVASRDVIRGAVEREATDIHLEPKGEDLQVRYRVDGELFTAVAYDAEMGQPLLASLKVAAEMDIAERRRSQDGSFKAMVDDRAIDFRVSTAPSAYGEKMVIRVLDKAKGIRRLENLGFQPAVLEQVRRVIHLPHGMLLACGPTGSGKSTTLYAALSEMDATRKNIITIENPIEYHLPNVTQTPINEKAGVTFASVLRSSLRQDPDVLMVGEIRDAETAEVAMQAAMTGHLVFSTLHANDSVSSVFRLLDLGLEPFMISSALSGVLAQRLVKMLCSECKQAYSPKPEFIELAEKRGIPVAHFYKPVGCDRCNGLGHKGRLGAFEFLTIDDAIRSLLQSKPGLTELHAAAKDAGFMYLREDALIKATQGLTSVEEVLSLTTV